MDYNILKVGDTISNGRYSHRVVEIRPANQHDNQKVVFFKRESDGYVFRMYSSVWLTTYNYKITNRTIQPTCKPHPLTSFFNNERTAIQ